jgi:hypothetical protein
MTIPSRVTWNSLIDYGAVLKIGLMTLHLHGFLLTFF